MDTSTRMYVCMTWCADVESCAPMVSVRLLKKKIMVKEEKFSLTDGQSSLTNSILGFVGPFICKSATIWRKWGYLERAMLGEVTA